MFLTLREDTYCPVFPLEQMLLMREFEAVHKVWGIRGIYFVVLFGWKGSPFIDEDETVREKTVIDRISEKSWYGTGQHKLIEKPSAPISVRRSEIKAAIEKINQKYPVPEIEDYDYYSARIKKMRDNLAAMNINVKNPSELKKAADTEQAINKNIKEMRSYQLEAEAAIASKYAQVKFLSLNDLINEVKNDAKS